MKAKLSFLAGAALGYVLGTRAGRESYEKIKASAQQAWSKDAVQDTVATVQDTVKTQAGEVVHKLVQQVLPGEKSDTPDAEAGGAEQGSTEPSSPNSKTPSSENGLYGSGGNPLDIVPEVSDEFPDAGLGGEGQSRTGDNRPVTGV
ncbi:YtxH domain-containing protein [Specibacter sp. NPDC057265]|uniref:YtxH domain-containing protein n=1 Tax=Specibacter sp. NPDC057265 TaxID=3346075 RepID=UPI0036395D51